MTATRTRRCVATHLGCTCADQAAHAAWVDANTTRIPGSEIRSGDTVYLAGRWQVVADVTLDGSSFRAIVESGRMSGNALSIYAITAR